MKIELPDEIANSLQSQASAQGLSLQAWLAKMGKEQPAKPHYTLSQLLEQCDPSTPLNGEDRAWLDAPSIGREII